MHSGKQSTKWIRYVQCISEVSKKYRVELGHCISDMFIFYFSFSAIFLFRQSNT